MTVERQDGQGKLPDHGDIRAETEEKQVQVLIIGGGPAGLAAGITAQNLGLDTLLIDENPVAGGQLLKQTHKFFGSQLEYAGCRGYDIAAIMLSELEGCGGQILTSTSAAGCYGRDEEGLYVYLAAQKLSDGYRLWNIRAERIIVTTGASEIHLTVPGNTLPGVYGAGGVQTLMHIYGTRPGNRALIVGTGNVGLILGYQFYQAGVEVEALIDIRQEIGGYLVHASKLIRMGAPILLGHTITKIHGEDHVTGASVAAVDEKGQILSRTEKHLEVDTVVAAVGLSACSEILLQAGCRQMYIPEAGGWAPVHNKNMETTQEGICVAGDAAGVAEASTAILEGRIAAARIAEHRSNPEEAVKVKLAAMTELARLRESSSLKASWLAKQRCHDRWEEIHARER
jgi:sarcosine oxidase subunit alpha